MGKGGFLKKGHDESPGIIAVCSPSKMKTIKV
jgi:hypothetical protein